MKTDVLIIGAGPAGIFTALEMIRKGTNKKIIKRARGDAKFHVRKLAQFYIVKDMTEEFIYNWRYIDEKRHDEIKKKLRERNKGKIDRK